MAWLNGFVNDDTKFILRQLSVLEGRLMDKIDHLMAFKNKALGIVTALSIIGGGIGAVLMEYVAKHL